MKRDHTYLDAKYNLGWVVRQTGVTADTIRAWEKRYHLPSPQRSDGNQRLYSDHDLEVILWLHQKVQEGVQISKAVSLWREHDASQIAPAEQTNIPSLVDLPADEMEHWMHQWLDACIRLDDEASTLVLDQAYSIFSHQLASRYVVFAGVTAMEKLWLSGERTSQYLHFARQAAARKIYSLMGAYPASAQTAGTLVLATIMEEEDPFRPVYLAYLARMAGWKTVNAGPQMMADPLTQILSETQAAALILVANQLHTAANAHSILQSIQTSGYSVFFCGTFFEQHPVLQERFPGVFLEEPWVDQILHFRQNIPLGLEKKGVPLNQSCERMIEQYQQSRIKIEQTAQMQLPAQVLQDKHFAMANYFMQRGIMAAMMLGDLFYLEEDLVWIHRLITNMGMGNSMMPGYAGIYREAIYKTGPASLQPLAEAITHAIERMRS